MLSDFTHGDPGTLQESHRAEVRVQEAATAIAEK